MCSDTTPNLLEEIGEAINESERRREAVNEELNTIIIDYIGVVIGDYAEELVTVTFAEHTDTLSDDKLKALKKSIEDLQSRSEEVFEIATSYFDGPALHPLVKDDRKRLVIGERQVREIFGVASALVKDVLVKHKYHIPQKAVTETKDLRSRRTPYDEVIIAYYSAYTGEIPESIRKKHEEVDSIQKEINNKIVTQEELRNMIMRKKAQRRWAEVK